MTGSFQDHLIARARRAEIDLSGASLVQLERYWTLLARWNRTINLTSLSLDEVTDHALDRLLVEPLCAAPLVPAGSVRWYDLGSGGGSPAIPMKILRPDAVLAMVESRERKAAFLREAVRSLRLAHATVDARRFEDVSVEAAATGAPSAVDLVTIRAVRFDDRVARACWKLLRPEGQLIIFSAIPPVDAAPFQFVRSVSSKIGSVVQVLERRR